MRESRNINNINEIKIMKASEKKAWDRICPKELQSVYVDLMTTKIEDLDRSQRLAIGLSLYAASGVIVHFGDTDTVLHKGKESFGAPNSVAFCSLLRAMDQRFNLKR